MKIHVIADSCCDATPAMRSTLELKTAPLKITVENQEFVDTPDINIRQLLAAIKATKKPVSTAAPAPEDYANLMRAADECIVVTLSRHLSGSYNSAVAARDLVLEDAPDKKILVVDSKSASAGETRIVLEIHNMILHGKTFDEIAAALPAFVDNMRTFFVLEDLSTLVKNGRIPKVAGLLGGMLMLRPIMGENGNGEIVSVEKVRGTKQALARLAAIVEDRTKDFPPASLRLTLSYCNCPERAAEFKAQLLEKCAALAEVIMEPTSGLSTCYANDGGVVIAFGPSVGLA